MSLKYLVSCVKAKISFSVTPKFLTHEAVFIGKIQENVSISFLIYCNPKDVTVKLFVNGSIANNNEKYVFLINEGVFGELNLTITITDLDERDFLNYLVDVTNPIGKTEVKFSVTAESKSAPNPFLFDDW